MLSPQETASNHREHCQLIAPAQILRTSSFEGVPEVAFVAFEASSDRLLQVQGQKYVHRTPVGGRSFGLSDATGWQAPVADFDPSRSQGQPERRERRRVGCSR